MTSLRTQNLIVIDQVVSSAGTFLFSIVVARVASPEIFGVFAICYAITWTSIGAARSTIGEVELLLGVYRPIQSQRAIAAALVLGSGFAFVYLLTATLFLWQQTEVLLIACAFGISSPLIFAADSARYTGLAHGAPIKAIVIDTVWALVVLCALIAQIFGYPFSVAFAVFAWGFGAGIGLTLGAFFWRDLRPTLHGIFDWIRGRYSLARSLLADFLVSTGIGQFAIIILAIVAGVEASGEYRGALVLIGPLNVAFMALVVIMTPQLRDRITERPGRIRTFLMAGGMWILGFSIAFGVLVRFVPPALGYLILGPNWAGAAILLPLLSISFGFQAASQLVVQCLRLIDWAGHVAKVRAPISLLTAGFLVFGGAIAGAWGAAFGSLLGAVIGGVTWWLVLMRVGGIRAEVIHR